MASNIPKVDEKPGAKDLNVSHPLAGHHTLPYRTVNVNFPLETTANMSKKPWIHHRSSSMAFKAPLAVEATPMNQSSTSGNGNGTESTPHSSNGSGNPLQASIETEPARENKTLGDIARYLQDVNHSVAQLTSLSRHVMANNNQIMRDIQLLKEKPTTPASTEDAIGVLTKQIRQLSHKLGGVGVDVDSVQESVDQLMQQQKTTEDHPLQIVIRLVGKWNPRTLIAAYFLAQSTDEDSDHYGLYQIIEGYARQLRYEVHESMSYESNRTFQELRQAQDEMLEKWEGGIQMSATAALYPLAPTGYQSTTCSCINSLTPLSADHRDPFACSARRLSQEALLATAYEIQTHGLRGAHIVRLGHMEYRDFDPR